MSKQKAFKRKLAKPHHGFRYYRIWGWPLDIGNVRYHQDKYGADPTKAIFYQPLFGWLHLTVEASLVSNHHRAVINGSINSRYFKTKEQAVRVLLEYKAGICQDGLYEMVAYHRKLEWIIPLSVGASGSTPMRRGHRPVGSMTYTII